MTINIPGKWLVWTIDSIVPLAVLALLAYLGLRVSQFYNSLIVQGKPDEWVVVMNNGVKKQAGVGLRVQLGLTDQVAIFPSKSNLYYFEVSQVTKEMQGLKIQATVTYSVYREGDGPMKAYKYFGDDLKLDKPKVATQCLDKVMESVVQDHIANHTIDDVIKKRD